MKDRYPNILIAEGGGMRGIFATGVLDRFLELGFDPFDMFIGVSSGAGNIAAFMARMPKRNLLVYTRYSLSPEFISLKKFIKGGHLMDLDWLWEKTIAEIRLDLNTIYNTGRPFFVCLTDTDTGRPVYKKTCARDLEAVLKASSALPVLYRKFPEIDGKPCTDGGIADPIPFSKALALGGRRIMVLRSRPRTYQKREWFSQACLRLYFHRYPAFCQSISRRIRKYNDSLDQMRHCQKDVDVIEVCPPDDFSIGRFCRNRSTLLTAYVSGKQAGDQAAQDWFARGGSQ